MYHIKSKCILYSKCIGPGFLRSGYIHTLINIFIFTWKNLQQGRQVGMQKDAENEEVIERDTAKVTI